MQKHVQHVPTHRKFHSRVADSANAIANMENKKCEKTLTQNKKREKKTDFVMILQYFFLHFFNAFTYIRSKVNIKS